MSTTCPVCGSSELKSETKRISLNAFYGEPVEFEEQVYCCLVCNECGDFSGENESRILAAVEKAKKHLIGTILEDLNELGIKMTYFERALDLPARTVSRWKSGDTSSASVALLRVVHAFPWLLEVADARFSPLVVQRKVLEAAGNIIYKALKPPEHPSAIISDYRVAVAVHATYKFEPQIKVIEIGA